MTTGDRLGATDVRDADGDRVDPVTPDGRRPVAFEGRALGSALRLQVLAPQAAHGSRRVTGAVDGAAGPAALAWSAVLEEFAAVDLALSRFRSDSELTALNRLAGTGTIVRVSQRLRTALAAVHRAGRLTGGRFDARVLGALERIGEQGAPLGTPATRAARSSGSGAESAGGADDARWPVVVPDEPLDMGGIGKGLALRWAVARAIAALPAGTSVLLEAGGDLLAGGPPPAGGWLVGIEDPVGEPGPGGGSEPLAVVTVPVGAVATSSIRIRRWVAPDGRPVHHLVDPRTGEPARTGLIAVTVAAPDPAWAEVWSKALFLAGRGAIADEARARGLAAWWIDERGALGMTPDARIRSAWVDEERLG